MPVAWGQNSWAFYTIIQLTKGTRMHFEKKRLRDFKHNRFNNAENYLASLVYSLCTLLLMTCQNKVEKLNYEQLMGKMYEKRTELVLGRVLFHSPLVITFIRICRLKITKYQKLNSRKM